MIGSLCTGIGGLDIAVQSVYGGNLAWYSELEPAPCAVLEREHPDVPNLGDLTTIDWRDVEPVDILTAGYPCQPFSHAGKRKGTDDVRHLWPHIAEAVRVLRPGRVVLENVAGHLSLGFGDVLGDLAESGFDAEWCVLRASDVGAPHQRARLFIVARDADRAREDALAPAGGSRHPTGESGGASAHASDLGHERDGPARRRRDGPANSDNPPANAEGTERRGAQQQGMASPAGSAAEPRERPSEGSDRGGITADADEAGLQGREPAQGHALPAGCGQVAWGQYEPAIARWEHVLGRTAPAPTDTAGRLSPRFVEWMMGYPQGWVDGLTRSQALKALGNAVVPQQGAAAVRLLTEVGA